MNAQPNVISKICHQVRLLLLLFITVGSETPVVGLSELLVEVSTSSDRHTPSPDMTLVEFVQFASTQVPERRYWVELEQERHSLESGPEQVEQLESQDVHEEEVLSKYSDSLHVGRHRPFVRTGRSDGQEEH